MFASLKNKIREETGSDLSKFTAKITTGAFKRHGSSSSVNSIVSQESAPKDPSDGLSEASEESRLRRLEADFARKEKEFREVIRDRNQTIERLERERDEAQGEARNYKELLKNAQEAKQKLANHREDKQLIENLQTQELSKIKRLVLERDKELEVKSAALKEANLQLEKLRNEVGRLRRQEELLSDVQQNAETESKITEKNLENVESELEKSENETRSLKDNVGKLEKELAEERYYSVNIQNTLARVTTEKNTALLRNAEISQQTELAKQDLRKREVEVKELIRKLTTLEEENKILKDRDNKGLEKELRTTLAVLEEQISDKNKLIKTLQLRLSDMKKTLQQELRTPTNNAADMNAAAVLTPSQTTTIKSYSNSSRCHAEDDVNFKYLKHVLIKFLTSREYEAQHLIRAVATLLEFSPDEEKLLHDTIEWRMSWFGSKPKSLGKSNRQNS